MSVKIDTVKKTEETETAGVKKAPKFSLRKKILVISAATIVLVIAGIVYVLHYKADATISEYTKSMETIDLAFYSDNANGGAMLSQMQNMSELKSSLNGEINPFVRSDSDLEKTIDTDLKKMQAKINDYYVARIASIESGYNLESVNEDYQALIDTYRTGVFALIIVKNNLLKYDGLLDYSSMSFTLEEINSEIKALEAAITTATQNLQSKIAVAIVSYNDGITANTVVDGSLESYRNAIAALGVLKTTITANSSFVGMSDTTKYSDIVDAMIADYSTKAADLQAQADAAAAEAAKAAAAAKHSSSGSTSKSCNWRPWQPSDGKFMIYNDLTGWNDMSESCAGGWIECTVCG